ncbi:hypothetical protein D3C80_2004950 [compost metagenome]
MINLAKERDHQDLEGEDDAKHAAPEQRLGPPKMQLGEAVGRQYGDKQCQYGDRQRRDDAVQEEDRQIPHGQHTHKGVEDDGIG